MSKTVILSYIIFMITLITATILLVTTDGTKLAPLAYATAAAAIIIFIIYIVILFISHKKEPSVVKQLLKLSAKENTPENKFKADQLCDLLFKSQDKETYEQYLDMKANRPDSEVKNLCINFAKTLVNRPKPKKEKNIDKYSVHF